MKLRNAAKIFIKNKALNKYLLYLRDNKENIPDPNVWDLFGGGIEEGEAPLKAIKRELKEEVDIDVFNIKPSHSNKLISSFQGKEHEEDAYYFWGETLVEDLSTVSLNEGQKMAFFSIEEISQMENISMTVRELISAVEKLRMSAPS